MRLNPLGIATVFFLLFFFNTQYLCAQQFVFAELKGSPVINTTGWTMYGNAGPGDTGGDADTDPNELIVCNATGSASGSIFYDTPLDLGQCDKWSVAFDYRIFDGSGADGLAFCFLANPPTGPINGGGLGIPSAPLGLMVALDPYQNCGGANPELQIRYGNGVNNYYECPTPAQPTLFGQTILRQNNYNRMLVTYDNGTIEVYINGAFYLAGTYLTNYVGYLGFTSSTGSLTDNHSIRNVIIYTDTPESDAGADRTICSGQTTELGTAPSTNYNYSWSPTTGLSNPAIANPEFSEVNTSGSPVVRTFIVTTDSAGVGCSSMDTVVVTVESNPVSTYGCDLDSIKVAFAAAGCMELSGCDPGCSMYFYNPQSLTGDQAQAFAENLGANLVSVQSAAENTEIINALNANGLGGIIWIGFNDQAVEGSFVWYDQSQITYTNWAPGEPNDQNGEDCTQIYPSGQWNDLDCASNNSSSVIEVSLCPELTVSNDTSICEGNSVTLNASTILGSLPYTYTWSTGVSGSTITVTPAATTVYTVTVTGRYGCSVSDDITITVEQIIPHANSCDLDAIRAAFTAAGCTELSECNPGCSMYFYNPQSLTGDQAQAFAENLGANLISVQTAAENTFIQNALNANGFGGVIWIGFNDIAVEGTFVWYDQSQVTYTNWAPGEPNQSGNEDCTQIYPNGQWNDLECNSANSSSVIEVNLCPELTVSNDTAVCPGQTVVLTASTILGSEPYSYLWSNNSTDTFITLSPFVTDTYEVSVTGRYGCTVSKSITVTINNLNATVSNDTSYCEGEDVQLMITGGVAYQWIPTTDLSCGSCPNPIASPNTTTNYDVAIADANGCVDTLSVLVTVHPQPVALFTGLLAGYCDYAPEVFLSGNPFGGTFSGPGMSNNLFSPTIAGSGIHDITYSVTSIFGCADDTTMSTTVFPQPVASISGLDASYCEDAAPVPVILDPTGGTLTGTGLVGTTFDPAIAAPGTYDLQYIYADANLCADTTFATVTVSSVPSVVLTPTDVECYGYENGSVSTQVTNGTDPYNYQWDDDGSSTTEDINNLGPGTYSVQISDVNGCTAEGQATVEEPFELTVSAFTDKDTVSVGDSALLTTIVNTIAPLTYEWNPTLGMDCPDCPETYLMPINEAGEYEILIVDADGCFAYDTVTVELRDPILYIPNAFTPNNDGVNDEFFVWAKGVKQFNLKIFDRWGEVVFSADSPEIRWDGTMKGKELTPGLFAYTLTIAYLDNTYKKMAGSIRLIR